MKPIEHGTTRGYGRGCRCVDCLAANAEYHRQRRYAAGGQPGPRPSDRDQVLAYPPPEDPDAPRTLRAAAEHFNVNPTTVRRWIQSGRLAEFRPPPPSEPRHGTSYSYRKRKCRCDACREWNAKAGKRNRMKRTARAQNGAALVQHGTTNGYGNFGCRCDACKAVHSAATKAQYRSRLARAKADPSVIPEHGRAAYTGWGCRCDICRTAFAADAAQRKARQAVSS